MIDAGNPIEIDFSSSEISVFENGRSNSRYIMGYISGELEKIDENADIYISVLFKRNTEMRWESITFKLNNDEKFFHQKLPAGLTVIAFYVKMYGLIYDEFELTNFKISIDEILVGKYSGKPLLLQGTEPIIAPRSLITYTAFLIQIPQVGNVTANTADVVWATTHRATGRVIYGTTPETMTSEVSNEEFDFYHILTLTGLNLEAQYYCQIYSISEETGEEIHSDILSFYTGKEITLEEQFGEIGIEFLTKVKKELAVINTISGREILTTLEPDGIGDVNNAMQFDTHTKVELTASNTIGGNFDYEVTP